MPCRRQIKPNPMQKTLQIRLDTASKRKLSRSGRRFGFATAERRTSRQTKR